MIKGLKVEQFSDEMVECIHYKEKDFIGCEDSCCVCSEVYKHPYGYACKICTFRRFCMFFLVNEWLIVWMFLYFVIGDVSAHPLAFFAIPIAIGFTNAFAKLMVLHFKYLFMVIGVTVLAIILDWYWFFYYQAHDVDGAMGVLIIALLVYMAYRFYLYHRFGIYFAYRDYYYRNKRKGIKP